ncbi:MAG TPA: hypothetical protein VEK08_08580 [Planctomycetota bacterium]|nr:hypothetical protein [Planctomycetota bacterium]
MAAKKYNPKAPTTIFDTPAVPNELKKAGISQFAKITAGAANVEKMKKYGAGPNTLVICAPNGDKLIAFAGEQCTQSNVTSFLKQFPQHFQAYMNSKKK